MTLGPTSRAAVVASAVYLVLAGAALVFGDGIAGVAPWRAVSLHVFGLGFVTFAVFGFGEHMLPRFTGAPIRVGRLAWIQQALVHAGLVLFAAGALGGIRSILAAGGLLAWLGLGVFAARLWPVIAHRG
jgi:hypothetical protein